MYTLQIQLYLPNNQIRYKIYNVSGLGALDSSCGYRGGDRRHPETFSSKPKPHQLWRCEGTI